MVSWGFVLEREKGEDLHGRSGRVAFPRMKVVPARPARDALGTAALAAERRADVRRRVVFIVCN
jgi:hypothetical protein